jgi:hypothetical protein
VLGLLSVAPAGAAAAGDAPGVTASVAAGAFRPSDETFRSLYGSPQWPLIVQVDVPVRGPVSVFAGARRLTREGATLAMPPAVDDERFPIELTVTSFRAGAAATLARHRGRLFAGLGAEYARTSERWPSADLSYGARGWGVVIQGGADIPVWRRFSLRGLIEYAATRAGDDPESGEKVDLGGITLAAGLSFRFGR